MVLDAGALDTSFDSDGRVITDVQTLEHDFAADVIAYGADNKLVAVGHANGNFIVVRYDADGSLDDSFGTGGKQEIDFDGRQDSAKSVAVDSAGRVVVAGTSRQAGQEGDFAVARLTRTGALDTSFGTAGTVRIDFDGQSDAGTAVVVDALDRVIVAGTSPSDQGAADFAVARLTSDGILDPEFATTGKQTIDFGDTSDIVGGVAVDSRNQVVVAGYSAQSGSGTDFAVARLTIAGELDHNFNSAGKQTVDFPGRDDFAGDVAVDSEGRVVLAGYSHDSEFDADFAVARLTADGVVDTSFATAGKGLVDFGTKFDRGLTLTVDGHGRLLVAGQTTDPGNNIPMDFAVMRLTSDGALDEGFGSEGKQRVDFGGTSDFLQGVTVDSLNRVVMLGFSDQVEAAGEPDTLIDFVLARLEAGEPPQTGDLEVPIDIKPGSGSNPINPRSGGKTEVAVLSTDTFDAVNDLNVFSLTFGRTGAETSLVRKEDGAPDVRTIDVNGDGLLDTVAAFVTRETQFQPGDTEGILRGATVGKRLIEGSDRVRIVGSRQTRHAEGESTERVHTMDEAWHNWAMPMDTNDDGTVSPLDALILVNSLNRGLGGVLPQLPDDAEINFPFLDNNNDGRLSPLDALRVINRLNRRVSTGEGEAAASSDPWADQVDAVHGVGDAAVASLATIEELKRLRRG